MFNVTSLKVFAVVTSVMTLTACNQPTQSPNPSPATSSTATTDPHAGHDMGNMASSTTASQPAHVTAYMQSMTRMQEQMHSASNIANPDVAFAKGMIPHHQGAIDMANVEMEMGKDKEMLALAKNIKLVQDPEIKQMQAWLDKNPK